MHTHTHACTHTRTCTHTLNTVDTVNLHLLDLLNAKLSLERYWRGPRSQEVGGGRTISNATPSPPEWFLHWDGQCWESFECFINCEGQCHKMVSANHNFGRERRAKAQKLTTSIYLPNNLPSGQTSSQDIVDQMLYFDAFLVMDRCFLWQCQAFLCSFSWLACRICAKCYVWTGHRLILSYFYT